MAMAKAGVSIKQKHNTLRRGRFMVFSTYPSHEHEGFQLIGVV